MCHLKSYSIYAGSVFFDVVSFFLGRRGGSSALPLIIKEDRDVYRRLVITLETIYHTKFPFLKFDFVEDDTELRVNFRFQTVQILKF